MTKQEALQACRVDGTTVLLPPTQLDRKVYLEVKSALELIGGKWNTKAQGFVFKEDPTELLADVASGEKRNLQKEYQFFPTPPDVADWMAAQAFLHSEHTVLEPSAGQGALIEAALRDTNLTTPIDYYELMPLNRQILDKKGLHVNYCGEDFLKAPIKLYDRIIANPPFAKNQDIDHIYKMYACLAPGGRLLSVASTHWDRSENKKEKEFKQWLKKIEAASYPLDSGRFKSSGTMVASVIIEIDK